MPSVLDSGYNMVYTICLGIYHIITKRLLDVKRRKTGIPLKKGDSVCDGYTGKAPKGSEETLCSKS
jgi:hypothetical protein